MVTCRGAIGNQMGFQTLVWIVTSSSRSWIEDTTAGNVGIFSVPRACWTRPSWISNANSTWMGSWGRCVSSVVNSGVTTSVKVSKWMSMSYPISKPRTWRRNIQVTLCWVKSYRKMSRYWALKLTATFQLIGVGVPFKWRAPLLGEWFQAGHWSLLCIRYMVYYFVYVYI